MCRRVAVFLAIVGILSSGIRPPVVLGADSSLLQRATEWRAQFGFSIDAAGVSQIVAANYDTPYGAWLTPQESQEMDRRGDLRKRLEPALEYVNSHPDIFGGNYFNQSLGNMDMYVVATKRVAEADKHKIEALIPADGAVHFVTGDWSRNDLDAFQREMGATAAAAHVDISYTALDISTDQVVYGNGDANPAIRALLQKRPSAYRHQFIGPLTKTACEIAEVDPRSHCLPLEGGDQIVGNKTESGEVIPKACTLGFLAAGADDTVPAISLTRYAITAGHCFDDGVTVYHRSDTDPGVAVGTADLHEDDQIDAGRVLLYNQYWPLDDSSNQIWDTTATGPSYHVGAPGTPVTSLRLKGDQNKDDTVCENGVSSASEPTQYYSSPCGKVEFLQMNIQGQIVDTTTIHAASNDQGEATGGDSGGSIYAPASYPSGATAYGVVKGNVQHYLDPWGQIPDYVAITYTTIDDTLSATHTRLCLDPVCGPFGAFSLRKSDNGIDEGESSIGTTSSTFTVIGAALDSAEFPIYYWGDGTASAENTSGTASHTYTASGVYHLTQDAVSAQNSLATDIVGTYVTIADSSPTFSWVSNLPGNALIAQTQATFLTGSESGYTNCHWDWGDGTTLDYCSPSVLHTFAMAGNYTVSLTLSNPGQDIGPNAGSEIVIVVPPAVLTGVSGNIIGFPTSVDETGAPLNYWASIQGLCTLKVSGDPYATKVTTSVPANCGTAATTNSEYYQPAVGAPGAYNYLINVQTPGPVVVDLYDPQFCPRASSNFNTGDTNFSGSSNFNTAFTLYGPSSTPTDPSDDQVMTAVSYPGDGSTSTNDGWGGATHSCSSYYVSGTNGNYTGKWLNFATFNAPSPGVYRLNVKTSSTVGNRADGNNQFALRTSSNGGSGTQPIITATTANDSPLLSGMITISSSGNHEIRLAQVDASAAGHTLEIDLFDPGDCTASTSISLETPTTNGYQTATVNWRDAGLTLGSSGTLHYGVSSISTSNGSAFFNGHWLVVTIAIPADYTAPQGGWLKLKYNTSGTWQDRLTWQASLQN